jgi:methylglutamate dehydrogenase subunit B
MRIHCPYCGSRGLEEFSYRGAASVARPNGGGAASPQAWADYIYLRTNGAGMHREFWLHAGCHSWLVVTRELNTHEIVTVEFATHTGGPRATMLDSTS